MPDSFFVNPKKRKRPTSTSKGKQPSRPAVKPGKNGVKGGTKAPASKRKRTEDLDSDGTPDEGIDAIDDLDLAADNDEPVLSDAEDPNETPAEKRLRLAKVYLDSLKQDLGEGDIDAAEVDRELISSRLQRDVLDEAGKVYITVADSLNYQKAESSKLKVRGHKAPLTVAKATANCRYLFTTGKDGAIMKWDLYSGENISVNHRLRLPTSKAPSNKKGKKKASPPDLDNVEGHVDEIWALAASTDGKYLASGGKDRRVGIWEVETMKWIKGFRGHRDSISGLVFRKNASQLYSSSFDRTIKLFDLSVMGYVETLFGHQDCIGDLDALKRESAVSCGGRDKTVRFWKIPDETQLVFRGGTKSKLREVLEGGMEEADADDDNEDGKEGKTLERRFVEGSIDCVAMIDESTFVSGGDSGTLALWVTQKKKPVFTVPVAHGLHEIQSETEGIVATPRWITSLACLAYSDLLASGSWEGSIRLWKVDPNPRSRSISMLSRIEAPGFVNSLQVLSLPGSFGNQAEWVERESGRERPKQDDVSSVLVVAALGKEPRTGRWMHVSEPGVVNCAMAWVVGRRGED